MKVSFSPSVNVSPILMVPWLCRPMMSPAKASSAAWRSAAMKVSASAMRISLSRRTWYMRMPRLYLPEHRRMNAMRSRCCGSMFAWILNTKPVSLPSIASTSRCTVSCLSGAGACVAKCASSSSTPKFEMAEPKNTGVCLPARYSATSNSAVPPRTSSISSSNRAARSPRNSRPSALCSPWMTRLAPRSPRPAAS